MFQVNAQQWIALSAIASLDDFGYDGEVTLLTGRKYRLPNDKLLLLKAALGL